MIYHLVFVRTQTTFSFVRTMYYRLRDYYDGTNYFIGSESIYEIEKKNHRIYDKMKGKS